MQYAKINIKKEANYYAIEIEMNVDIMKKFNLYLFTFE